MKFETITKREITSNYLRQPPRRNIQVQSKVSLISLINSFRYHCKVYLESAEAILVFVKGKVVTFAFKIVSEASSLLLLFKPMN